MLVRKKSIKSLLYKSKASFFKLKLINNRDCFAGDIKFAADIKEAVPEVKKAKVELKKPSMYKVLLINDDYTPMDFVVDILCVFFNMQKDQAEKVMMAVHTNGSAVCGVFTKDIAETKKMQVNELSKKNQFPLLCKTEKVD